MLSSVCRISTSFGARDTPPTIDVIRARLANNRSTQNHFEYDNLIDAKEARVRDRQREGESTSARAHTANARADVTVIVCLFHCCMEFGLCPAKFVSDEVSGTASPTH